MKLFSTSTHNITTSEEVVYANFAALASASFALIIAVILWLETGSGLPVYATFAAAVLFSLTLFFNYFGLDTLSRIYLSFFPTLAIIAIVVIDRLFIPYEVQTRLVDARLLILGVSILPMLLFSMSEWPYFTVAIVLNIGALYFIEFSHYFFLEQNRQLANSPYYISSHYYLMVLSFVIGALLTFKIRLCRSNKTKNELLDNLEEKVKERTRELEMQAEELIKSNNEMEQFSFTVSHNLRGPIARMLGLVGLLDKVDEKERMQIVEQLTPEVLDLDNIISDLNEILQIRHNLYKVKERIDITAEVRYAQKLLGDSPQKICCLENMELDIQENTYYGVKAFMQSILYHLIGNAFKYKKEGVDLKVEVKTRREGDKFILQVCDNGRGINLDKFGDTLFKLYARLDASAQGKGVGLYLVKKQVEAMNGTIEVASQLQVGTTFTITLPIPSSSQIRHQVAFENQVVKVTFDGMTATSIAVWHRTPASEEFKKAIMANLEKIREYPARFWINDTTRFGKVSQEDITWFVEEILPRATRLDLKAIVIVHSLGKGFDSPHWSLLKKFCAQHNIVFAFKNSLEEAGIFLASLRPQTA